MNSSVLGLDRGGAARSNSPAQRPVGGATAGNGDDAPGRSEAGAGDATVRLDAGVVRWRGGRAWQMVARGAVVLALLGIAAYPGQRSVRAIGAKNGADYQSIASIIRHDQQPGDGLVIAANSRSLTAGTNYYLRHDSGRPPNLLTERTAAAAAQLAPIDYPDAVAHVQGTRRVWLLVGGRHNDPTWARTDLRTLLRTKYDRVGLWHLKWSTLALYTLHP